MKLKDLMDVLPGYVLAYVHDMEGEFAYCGIPSKFIDGAYGHLGECVVLRTVPFDAYKLEVMIEKNKEETK